MSKGKPFPFAKAGDKSKPPTKPTVIGKGVAAAAPPFMKKGGRAK